MKTSFTSKLLLLTLLFSSGLANSQPLYFADAGPNKYLCLGDSVSIGGSPIAGGPGGFPPFRASWTPTTNISNPTANNPKVSPTSDTWYYLQVTDANGRSAFDSVLITVHSPSPVTLDSLPDFCRKDPIYTLQGGSPTGGYYLGPGISDSSNFDPLFAPLGLNEVTYYNVDTICNSTDSASRQFNLYDNPTSSVNPSSYELCIGDSVMLTASGGKYYSWSPPTDLSSTTDSMVWASPIINTIYKVLVSDDHCADSSIVDIQVEDCFNYIGKISVRNGIKIYPNPTSEVLTLDWGRLERIQAITIYNSHYQKVMIVSGFDQESINIDVSELNKGIYTMVINTEFERLTRQILIE